MIAQTLDYRLTSLISPEQAHTFRVVPLEEREDKICFLAEASARQHVPTLKLLLGKEIELEEILSDKLDEYLWKYYPQDQGQNQATTYDESASDTVRFVSKCLEDAASMKASDIHMERYEKSARIRFRWEGQLIEKYEIPLHQYNAIISRVKILSELDISERRLPQDGRIHFTSGGKQIDVRVSTIPGKYGEKAVLRLLTRSEEHLNLDRLGMDTAGQAAYQKVIQKPNGIILITGPTGSGKTTTLYATLAALNRPDKNILTIEDPIEYNLSGINQVQLKEEIGLSFDRALRAFLRQDPDIIMVGEIRDVATAQIAIRASLTGHLVFSTLHTNSSWDAITRLTDMGIEPYLLAASLRLVVAQRLVRKLCDHCKTPSEKRLYPNVQEPYELDVHYLPKGCPQCYFTGYKGRQAVYEILPLTSELATFIKSLEGDISAYMKSKQIQSLEDNLAALVRAGETSLEEALIHWADH